MHRGCGSTITDCPLKRRHEASADEDHGDLRRLAGAASAAARSRNASPSVAAFRKTPIDATAMKKTPTTTAVSLNASINE